jgi:hypothetical protein
MEDLRKEFDEFKEKTTAHMHRHDLWLTVVILSSAFLALAHWITK